MHVLLLLAAGGDRFTGGRAGSKSQALPITPYTALTDTCSHTTARGGTKPAGGCSTRSMGGRRDAESKATGPPPTTGLQPGPFVGRLGALRYGFAPGGHRAAHPLPLHATPSNIRRCDTHPDILGSAVRPRGLLLGLESVSLVKVCVVGLMRRVLMVDTM